jgi:hypothetical protein
MYITRLMAHGPTLNRGRMVGKRAESSLQRNHSLRGSWSRMISWTASDATRSGVCRVVCCPHSGKAPRELNVSG